MFSVYQHWDPLKVCVVGRSYPPEFYSWIKVPHVRSLFEKIAIETEEDYQNIIKKLHEFGVEVLRPDLPDQTFVDGRFVPPPMTPRDYTIMIGNVFYTGVGDVEERFKNHYRIIKDTTWPECSTLADFENLPSRIKQECREVFKMRIPDTDPFTKIVERIKQQGNTVESNMTQYEIINGAMVSRIGKDLYFGAPADSDTASIKKFVDQKFSLTRNHVVNTQGHSDGTYCPVCPGLIISLEDVPTYKDTFPGWEVVYLPNQSWAKVRPFLELKLKNRGRWWIPGFEQDQAVIDVVEQWLGHWTGYVEETVFDVNMLIIDPKNVMVFNYNQQVFDALARYGITPHVVPLRHRYFWDGGIHCVTSDLHRDGSIQDFFPNTNYKC